MHLSVAREMLGSETKMIRGVVILRLTALQMGRMLYLRYRLYRSRMLYLRLS